MYVQLIESKGYACLDWFDIIAIANFYQEYLCIDLMVAIAQYFHCLWQFCDSLFIYVGVNCAPIIKSYLKTTAGESGVCSRIF